MPITKEDKIQIKNFFMLKGYNATSVVAQWANMLSCSTAGLAG